MDQVQTVLFVDDDAAVRSAFSRALRGKGFQLDLADSFESALQLAQDAQYAVIATDFRMPKVDGLELIDKLHRLQPDATYMMISGNGDLSLALQAFHDHGVSFFLKKPWDEDELITALQRSINSHWERISQRQVQRSMVEASRELDEQRRRLEDAVAAGHTRLAEALLGAFAMRGHETAAHCRRVAGHALTLAEALGLKGRVLTAIEQGALLHDIGLMGVSDAVLLKAGPLTPEEWKIIRGHPEMGARLLEGMEYLQGPRDIVRQHHERWDGSGYPIGLSGPDICVGARIFAICDTMDAILSDRPYRKGASIEVAMAEILRGGGTLFDPEVVSAFQSVPPQRWLATHSRYPESLGALALAPSSAPPLPSVGSTPIAVPISKEGHAK